MDSPTTTDTAIGRKIGITTTNAVNATKIPLSVMLPIRPPASPLLLVSLTATPMMIGIAASTSNISWFRVRRNNIPISLAISRRPGSATDIEALPGQLHEDVLQPGLGDRKAAHPDPGGDQRRDHLLRLTIAQHGRGAVVQLGDV